MLYFCVIINLYFNKNKNEFVMPKKRRQVANIPKAGFTGNKNRKYGDGGKLNTKKKSS